MVLVGDEKMSKSLGNFRTLAELLDAWDPRALRLLVLQTHYRRTMEINEDGMTAANAALDRLDSFERRVAGVELLQTTPDESIVEKFKTAMDDDLGTASALAVIFDAVREANRALDTEDIESASALVAAVRELLLVLGVELSTISDNSSDGEEIDSLVAARTEAKLSKDFAEADRIRDELSSRGVVLEDGPSGTIWYRS